MLEFPGNAERDEHTVVLVVFHGQEQALPAMDAGCRAGLVIDADSIICGMGFRATQTIKLGRAGVDFCCRLGAEGCAVVIRNGCAGKEKGEFAVTGHFQNDEMRAVNPHDIAVEHGHRRGATGIPFGPVAPQQEVGLGASQPDFQIGGE